MRGKLVMVTVLAAVIGGCVSGGSPATAPTSATTTTTTVTTLPPATTTTVATTTTADRVAEIEAIFQDLEERRLQALYDGDRDAFRALFANNEYLERSMGVLDAIEFIGEPGSATVRIGKVLADDPGCLAAVVTTDATDALGPEGSSERIVVLESELGRWGYSYVGEGWQCDGPHPLSR